MGRNGNKWNIEARLQGVEVSSASMQLIKRSCIAGSHPDHMCTLLDNDSSNSSWRLLPSHAKYPRSCLRVHRMEGTLWGAVSLHIYFRSCRWANMVWYATAGRLPPLGPLVFLAKAMFGTLQRCRTQAKTIDTQASKHVHAYAGLIGSRSHACKFGRA